MNQVTRRPPRATRASSSTRTPCRSSHRFLTVSLIALLLSATLPLRGAAQQETAPRRADGILLPSKFGAGGASPDMAADSPAFVINTNEDGETVCSDATLIERRELNRHSPDVEMNVMPQPRFGEAVRPALDSLDLLNTATTDAEAATADAATDGNMQIILRETTQLQNSPRRDEVRAAFQRAAATWEALIKMPITIVIDVDYGENWFGAAYNSRTLGQTSGGPTPIVRYADLVQTLTNPTRTTDPTEFALYNLLPKTPTLTADIGAVDYILVSQPLARALGFRPATVNPDPNVTKVGDAPRIGFNSAYAFDFNPNDGIAPNTRDFDAVAVHEMGHALGFTSKAGDHASEVTINGVNSTINLMSVWDLYRFRPGTNMGTFTTANRILTPGTNENDIHGYFAGGAELELSNGGPTGSLGDKFQSSHWRDDRLRFNYATPWIGIMDPNLESGVRRTLTDNDVKALDTLGYQVNGSAPQQPSALVPLTSAVSQTGTIAAPPSDGQGFVSTTQYTIDVPSGATGLTINLDGSTSADIDLFVRQGQPTLFSGGLPITDYRAEGATGSEVINITNGSAPPLQAGKYYIAIANYGPGSTTFSLKATVATPAQYQTVVPTLKGFEFKTWQINGRTDAYLKLTFPTGGYRVADGGQVASSGNGFSADARIERFSGAAPQAESSTALIYNLGALTPGSYTFTFKASGTTLVSAPFVVSSSSSENTINDARAFVRQQYLDFLNREPDAPGWDHWTNEITSCGGDAVCIDRKRVNTSGAFFLSLEHQSTGYYVYRLYGGAFNRQPLRSELTPDARSVASGIVVGNALSAQAIDANKAAFARAFVERSEFKGIYDAMTDEQFVARLLQNTGSALNENERAELSIILSSPATRTERRAAVLQRVVDGMLSEQQANGGIAQRFVTRYGQEFYNREYNRAFVLMQYFGYLQRDADAAGYAFWLAKLIQFNGDFTAAQMVRSFIVAPEYRSRFGQP